MSRLSVPTRPTRVSKVLFKCNARYKEANISGAIKAYFKSRGERPKRKISKKEFMQVLEEIYIVEDFFYDTSTGTIHMHVKERLFTERMNAYKDAVKKYKKARAKYDVRRVQGSKRNTEKVLKAGVKREQDWLYYLDKNCNIARSPMVGGKYRNPDKHSSYIEVVVKTNIKREDGHIYFIDPQGDVSRTKLSSGKPRSKPSASHY